MLLSLLLALQVAPGGPQPVYHARQGQTEVSVPRVEATTVVDGVLDEPVWSRAALLTGFSVYQPVDQRPSPDSTDVLVWYSRDAIHFGVRAFEPHGAVRATLADRDKVTSDDNVEILLDTYDERNRAMVFAVNALGVQADGNKSEGGGFIPGSNVMPGQNDLSADYTWESKGRITDQGYEVEIRIPFSSLRYPTAAVQDWGIQIQRNVQHSGYQITWTETRKAAASFIDQEGTLVGLTGMHHGQVVQLNPELTTTISGAPEPPPPRPRTPSSTSPLDAEAGATTTSPVSAATCAGPWAATSSSTARSSRTSARWRPTPPRSPRTSASRSSTRSAGPSSWRAPTSSTCPTR